MELILDSGSWSPDPTAPEPCFRATSRQAGADDDTATNSDDEVTDLASDVFSDPTGPTSDPRHAEQQRSELRKA